MFSTGGPRPERRPPCAGRSPPRAGEAEFEAQAEVAAAVHAHASRYSAPSGLSVRLRELTGLPRASGLKWENAVWAAAGALAASLAIAVGLSVSQKPEIPERELFAIVAREARAEYRRAMLDPRPIQTGSTALEKILGWFEPHVNFRPRVYFAGGGDTVLEGGRVGYVSGIKVSGFIYRWRGKRVILIVFPALKNPVWARLPKKKWLAMKGEAPTASVWRRGDLIYSVVGDAPVEKMREFSRAITPKSVKF